MNPTGAQPVPAGTVPAMSLKDIERIISAKLSQFAGVDGDRKTARAAADAATDSAIGERESLLTSIADIAHRASWDQDDANEAIKSALKARNAKDASINTFASEIRKACHKRVRGHVGAMFALAREAWDTETETLANDAEAPKPLRRAYARCYHLVVQGMFKAAADDGRQFGAADELVEYAEQVIAARQVNYDRVIGRLKAIRKELDGFHKDFPDDGIGACLEYLEAVSKDDLKAARARVEQVEPDSDNSDAPTPEQDDAPTSTEDLIDDALRDLHAEAA